MAFQIKSELLKRIAYLYNIDLSLLKSEGGFENLFYGYSNENQEFLVRIKSDVNLNTKSYNQIRAEIDWIRYLVQNSVSVSAPKLSRNYKYVEKIIIGNNSYIVVSFQKAPGRYINFQDPEEWNGSLWEKMGELVGKMHKLSIKYRPDENFKRIDIEEDVFLKMEEILDKEIDKSIIEKYSQMRNWISTLSKPKDAYGIVHGDLNWGNYYIHRKTDLMIFDFDSCCYNWFIYDLAILIYSLIWSDPKDSALDFLKEFIPPFYKGYSKHYSLNNKWIEIISEFLYLHDLFLYTAITKTVNAGNTVEDYPSMLKILRIRCDTGISKTYFTKSEWINLFQKEQ